MGGLAAWVQLFRCPPSRASSRGRRKLLWLGAFKDYAPYKLERIKLVQPEVLLVGSSRCGQARAQMFRPYKTYNACLTAWPLEHVVDFIDRATRDAKPRVVIVALDYFLFGDCACRCLAERAHHGLQSRI